MIVSPTEDSADVVGSRALATVQPDKSQESKTASVAAQSVKLLEDSTKNLTDRTKMLESYEV